MTINELIVTLETIVTAEPRVGEEEIFMVGESGEIRGIAALQGNLRVGFALISPTHLRLQKMELSED